MNLAFVNGRRYVTGAGTRPGGVAVRDGRIVAVGADTDVVAAAGTGAEIVDARGGLISPSFGDAHLHPAMGGLQLGQCHLDRCTSAEECLDTIAAFAAEHPGEAWILGGGWSMEHFPGGTPHRSLLDRVVSDRPVFLRNRDHHGAWVNSRALELADIGATTADPLDGRIERDPDGSPAGTLHEGAAHLVTKVAPPPTRQSLLQGLLRGQAHCLAQGITQWQDALLRVMGPGLDAMDVYLDALADDALQARVTGALWWDRDRDRDQIADLVARRGRARGHDDLFRADAVKIMLDGVAENFTASLSRPYRDRCGHETGNRGLGFIDRDLLKDIVATVDARGFQAHFHAIGDQAVTDALDAVAHARRANGDSGIRHHIAHLQIVRDEDVPRFGTLGVIANIQPLWARFEPQMTELTIPFLDPALADRQYPFLDLYDAGAVLAGGSDWPVSSANPLEGMHVAVNRTPEHSPPGTEPFIPRQRLPLVVAWDAYTRQVAYLNGREQRTGRLEPGYLADLVLLDRDPFLGPRHEIADTAVVGTWLGGQCVYRRG
ncbi:amidohydrolase [Streptomyces spongiae]|uniref:amidohydrolase n=1 Tax=Streptomyces spongiae TaxID=565072 RepID=UPI0018846939|nr:amidohydrolase [Streptomyces spongiae]